MTLLRETPLKVLQFATIRQTPEPQQIAGLFKSGMVSQFVNVNAAIGKNTAIAIDITNAGVGGNNAFQSFGGRSAGHAGHRISLSKIGYRCGATPGGARRVQLSFIRQKALAFQAAGVTAAYRKDITLALTSCVVFPFFFFTVHGIYWKVAHNSPGKL